MITQRFRLHEGPPFVTPDPGDAGSAKILHALGFTRIQALFPKQ